MRGTINDSADEYLASVSTLQVASDLLRENVISSVGKETIVFVKWMSRDALESFDRNSEFRLTPNRSSSTFNVVFPAT